MPQTSPDFIFMLTNQDRTVADAAERLQDVLAAGIRHVGFKDIGLPFDKLLGLASAIKAGVPRSTSKWSASTKRASDDPRRPRSSLASTS